MNLNENEKMNLCKETFKKFMNILEDDNWVLSSTTTLADSRVFNMFEMNTDLKFPALKCVGVVKNTPEKILDFFVNASLENRKKVTPNLSKYKIVKDIDSDIHLLHYVYKAPFPVKSRDFCLKRFIYRIDKNILICAISTIDDALPPLKKYIRGEIIISGYYFETISDKETKITSIIHIDPKGWIPNFVVKASKNGELAELINLAEFIEENSFS